MIVRELTFKLETPVDKVAFNGNFITLNEIIIKAPAVRHRRICTSINNAYMSAALKLQKDNVKETAQPDENVEELPTKKGKLSTEEALEAGTAYYVALSASDSDDLHVVIDNFIDLLSQGCGLLVHGGSTEGITKEVIDQFDYSDLVKLFKVYCGAFLSTTLAA